MGLAWQYATSSLLPALSNQLSPSAAAATAKTVAVAAPTSAWMMDYLTANWFNMASGVCAVVALIFSAWSFKRSNSSAIVASQREDIASQYSQFTDFNRLRLEFPRQSHLMEVPEHYRAICDEIKGICDQEADAVKAELRIQERGVAILIFSMYEKLLFDLQTIKSNEGDSAFIDAVLSYLRSQWLRNPRLLYFWSRHGAALCSLFESGTCLDYEERIAAYVREEDIDVVGPFDSRRKHEAPDTVSVASAG